jgi:hypothetical protein
MLKIGHRQDTAMTTNVLAPSRNASRGLTRAYSRMAGRDRLSMWSRNDYARAAGRCLLSSYELSW